MPADPLRVIEALETQLRVKTDAVTSLEIELDSLKSSRTALINLWSKQVRDLDDIVRQRNFEADIANARISELEAALAIYRHPEEQETPHE